MSCVVKAVGTEPVTVTLQMRYVAALTRAIYSTEWGGTGGPLHCELDDFNLEDHWFDRDPAAPVFAAETLSWHPDADVQLCGRTWRALAQLTEPERHVAVAIGHGDIYDANLGEIIRFAEPRPPEPPTVTIMPDYRCSTCMGAIAAIGDASGVWVCSNCGADHGMWLNGGAMNIGIVRDDTPLEEFKQQLDAMTPAQFNEFADLMGGTEDDDQGMFD